MTEDFEKMLTGGHPNSLGRTVEVVELVLADRDKLSNLYRCYFSQDEVVRLRVSSAMKRVTIAHPDWTMDYMDGLLNEIAAIDQASTQWTLAILFDLTVSLLSPPQQKRALEIMKSNLENHDDWIVLNTTMKTLFDWSAKDAVLRDWLKLQLERLLADPRKSVSGRAQKLLAKF